MKVGIMQPYFFPYIGYFQLIQAVDLFIVYDNIKYTKKGWINRNRLLHDGRDVVFSLSLKKDSDSLDVRQRELAGDFNRQKLLNRIQDAYQRAPYFEPVRALIEKVLGHEDTNLFGFLFHALSVTCDHLGIRTPVQISSEVSIDHDLKKQDRVLALCEAVGAGTYINPIGGVGLYAREAFEARGIELKFLQSAPLTYAQYGGDFVPWLSIVDVMMFNPVDAIKEYLETGYALI